MGGFDSAISFGWQTTNTKVRDVAVDPSDDNAVWALRESDGAVVQWKPSSPPLSTWTPVSKAPKGLKRLAIGSLTPAIVENQIKLGRGPGPWGIPKPAKVRPAWAVAEDGAVWSNSSGEWTTVPGQLLSVAVAADRTVVGVDTAGYVVRWTSKGFERLTTDSGWSAAVAVEKAFILALRVDTNSCFRYNGASWSDYPPPYVHVGVNAAGVSFGPSAAPGPTYNVFSRYQFNPPKYQYYQSTQGVVRVSVGPTTVWGIDPEHNLLVASL
ncbi:MAG: hypothetical protein IPK82_30260 [Polyangiaceae bacterium]|nr:hypothetical protein [Polyangiaceae bacterium]